MNRELDDILLQTKRDIFLNSFAMLSSKFGGDGFDFEDIKEYEAGDSIKNLNAIATAKTNKPQINIFRQERDIKVILIFLQSSTMLYKNKQKIAALTLGALSYVAINTKNSLETIFFANGVEKFFKATKSSKAVIRNYQEAKKANLKEKRVNFKALRDFLISKRAAKVFLIGDFLEFEPLIPVNLKHELNFIIIREKSEEKIDFSGESSLIDLYDFKKYSFNINKKTQKKYEDEFKKQDEKLFKEFKKMQSPYIKIYNDKEISIKIRKILEN